MVAQKLGPQTDAIQELRHAPEAEGVNLRAWESCSEPIRIQWNDISSEARHITTLAMLYSHEFITPERYSYIMIGITIVVNTGHMNSFSVKLKRSAAHVFSGELGQGLQERTIGLRISGWVHKWRYPKMDGFQWKIPLING